MTHHVYKAYKEVWEGKRTKTPGGLTKKDLTLSKSGRIVSKKRQKQGRALAKAFPPQLTQAPRFA